MQFTAECIAIEAFFGYHENSQHFSRLSVHRFFALPICIASITLFSLPAWPGDDRTTQDPNFSLEDKSCHDLDRAYEGKNNSGRWSSSIYELYPNGNARLFLQLRMIDRHFFQKIESDSWQSYRRLPIHTTIDVPTGLPILTACQYEGVETIVGERTQHYAADWRRNGWEASLDAWVSSASGKIVKTVSHYRQGMGEFPFPATVQTMDYERSHVVEPQNLSNDGKIAFLKQDYGAALQIWRLQAERRDAAAQNGLGRLYGNGLGVPADIDSAIIWFRKAADQNYPNAQHRALIHPPITARHTLCPQRST